MAAQMVQDKPQPKPPTQLVEVPEVKQEKNLPLTIALIAFFLILTAATAYLGYQNYLLKKQLKVLEFYKNQAETQQPSDKERPGTSYFSEIMERKNIVDQKNINPGGTVSSGFLDPSVLSNDNKTSILSDFAVHAQDVKEVPFLFYVRDGITIKSLNLETNVESELFDLRDFPEIVINEYTGIHKQYFINKDKVILFKLLQDLGGEKYESGIFRYDLVTQKLSKIVSVEGSAASDANWHGFNLSPDEKYLFTYYVNSGEPDPFSDVPTPAVSDPQSFDNTFIFYDTTTGKLSKYKTAQYSPIGFQTDEWNKDSKYVVVKYDDRNNDQVFFKIAPNGTFSPLTIIKNSGRSFVKTHYMEDMNKIFYLATGGNTSEATFSKQLFGYYDLSAESFNDISDGTWETLDFVYDYTGGMIFDKTLRESGVVKSRSINIYSLSSGQTKKVIDGSLFIIGFNGDMEHVLASRVGQESLIYELDLTNGNLIYLAKAYTPISY